MGLFKKKIVKKTYGINRGEIERMEPAFQQCLRFS